MSTVRIGVIGGSGLGKALGQTSFGQIHELNTPFGSPSAPIMETDWCGLPVFLLARHGPGHLLNPSTIPSRANIFALKQLGVTHIIASGAVGSLREQIRPRDLVVCDQLIDKTVHRHGTFFDDAAVHVEFSDPFCPILRGLLAEAGRALSVNGGFQVHERGCYICMEGPAFSTRAESHMHRLWGGDVIGMTALPEAKLAREAEIAYAMLTLVTDFDCWKPHPMAQNPSDKHALLNEIISNLQAATDNAMSLIRQTVELIASRRDSLPPSPAHSALELAIWSDKAAIPPEKVKQLEPLWIKYFG